MIYQCGMDSVKGIKDEIKFLRTPLQRIYDSDKFHLAKTKEGFEKYYNRFYLDETRNLLKR